MKKGDKVIIKGNVKYFQDYSMWECDFEDGMEFEVYSKTNRRNSYWLKASGFGQKGNYGNGMIAIDYKYINPNLFKNSRREILFRKFN